MPRQNIASPASFPELALRFRDGCPLPKEVGFNPDSAVAGCYGATRNSDKRRLKNQGSDTNCTNQHELNNISQAGNEFVKIRAIRVSDSVPHLRASALICGFPVRRAGTSHIISRIRTSSHMITHKAYVFYQTVRHTVTHIQKCLFSSLFPAIPGYSSIYFFWGAPGNVLKAETRPIVMGAGFGLRLNRPPLTYVPVP